MIEYRSSNNPLTKQISSLTFSGGELHLTVDGEIGGDVTVLARLQSAHDLVELVLATELLRRKSLGGRFTLIAPYFPYARQDRITDPNAAFTLKTVANLINSMNYDRVFVYDPHSDVTPAVLDRCFIIEQSDIVRHMYPGLSEWMIANQPVIVAPDAGARKKAEKLAAAFGLKIVAAGKVRDPLTGKITETNVPACDAKTFLIADDICDGGRTFTEIGRRLKDGGAETVALYVTHGIFSAGYEVFQGSIDRIYTTSTFRLSRFPMASEATLFLQELPFMERHGA